MLWDKLIGGEERTGRWIKRQQNVKLFRKQTFDGLVGVREGV